MNYIQQAFKGKNETWMFFLTVFLVSGIFIGNIVFFIFFGGDIDIVEEQKKLLELVPSKNFWLAVNLAPFAILLGLLFILVKFLHQRSILSLTTARDKVDWSRVAFSFSLIVIITLVTFSISYYADPDLIKLQFDPVKFTILLIISLLLFPVQIGLEEYLFRGYLMQHLGFYVRNKWFPLILTSVLFGVMHGANPEVAEIGLITMVFYIGTGLLLGIMTLMDDGLELALGFHFGNNLLAAILVTSSWSALQTDAIFIYTSEEATNSILEIILPVFVVYPIILLIMAKKYGWKNWKDRLFGTILVPEIETINRIGIHDDENNSNL
ncbi:CPBP family intramembrane glutamic endopeptidase [Confluentibacter sediminis]|uniref:CPBP family intramembrane glutamic endopeptidase n=1 Tax=Confluentibacter sediminis TaxID=2219045 RepID=UPI000DAB91D7|nr:type II CAAX endopeptidase family protein [Confluentibacter sediminis]